MLESTMRWSKAQYSLADFGITLRIKRSKLLPDGRLRDLDRAYRAIGRSLVRGAEQAGMIPAGDRLDVQVLDPWSDRPRLAGVLGCWTGVRPEHAEMMRRTAFPKDRRYVEVVVPVEDGHLAAALEAT